MQKEKKEKHFIRKPVYPGGQAALRKFIKENMQYPNEAAQHNIEGTVTLKYEIDYRGRVVDAKVIKGLGYGCDEEAVRLARLLQFEVPKTRKVRVKFFKDLHVHFRKPKRTATKASPIQYQVTMVPKQAEKKSGNTYTYTVRIDK